MIKGRVYMERVFKKLVRDNIPEIIRSKGEEAVTRVLDEEEYRSELYKKLLEESNEVINAKDKDSLLEELADVLEVLTSIIKLDNRELKDIVECANKKREKRGGFDNRIFLEKTYDK